MIILRKDKVIHINADHGKMTCLFNLFKLLIFYPKKTNVFFVK